jgi:hypothetical protein
MEVVMKSICTLSTLGALLLTGLVARAQTPQFPSPTFEWHAELVALDEAARSVTLKAPSWGEKAPTEFGRLKADERVSLRWSGSDQYANSISGVLRPGDVQADGERFTFPATFVSWDTARWHVTFKVQIPQTQIANLKSMKPGEWVTAISPHGVSSRTTPVTTIRPYVWSPSATTSK